jgi:UDP-galactopyranose mutase
MAHRIVMAGADLSGAVIGRALAEAGQQITVMDPSPHVGGNYHTERASETGVLVQRYGPHVFHTDDDGVWDYATRIARSRPYRNRVKSNVGSQVCSLCVNLHRIYQFYGRSYRPEESRAFILSVAEEIPDPQTLEVQALAFIGRDFYEAFFKTYTEKQGGCSPTDLHASILKLLPLRFNFYGKCFLHHHQGIPEDGYTPMIAAILDHTGIDVHLVTTFDPVRAGDWDHVDLTGPLDAFLGNRLGQLGYLTLDFEEFCANGDWQGCAVMNYGDPDVQFTRMNEHKHFAPCEDRSGSVLYPEYSSACDPGDIPYYPIRIVAEMAVFADSVALTRGRSGPSGNVTFAGRVATYRYLDMDVNIREAPDCAAAVMAALPGRQALPRFSKDPQ